MTEAHLVSKKLAAIETYLHELRAHAQPDQIVSEIRERRFVEHTLQIAIQAALDAASHIVSDDRLGEPNSNRELFDLLAKNGWITPDLAIRLRRMAGFRNILVHGYAEVDPNVVRDVLENHLGDLEDFVVAVRARMSESTSSPRG
jgi:uncharacterized protein YutE (UPF0331/DUF86 family)